MADFLLWSEEKFGCSNCSAFLERMGNSSSLKYVSILPEELFTIFTHGYWKKKNLFHRENVQKD